MKDLSRAIQLLKVSIACSDSAQFDHGKTIGEMSVELNKARYETCQALEILKKMRPQSPTPGWGRVAVELSYRPAIFDEGGESRDQPNNVKELVDEIDRAMNASHFGGQICLRIGTVEPEEQDELGPNRRARKLLT